MNDHRLRVYDSILGLQSSEENPTPIVRLRKVVPFEHTQVYAKLEWYNPFGAVKDRIAANLIRDAEERGLLGPGKKLVEPTSGNTGLGLAMIGNAKGYSLRTPLSALIPEEKRTILRFFGVDVHELDDSLCPAPGAPEGAIQKAMDTAHDDPQFHMLNQYENEANPEGHYRTTGPEIWKQTGGKVTHFAAGLGTCGTITGTGKYLKEQNPDVQVIGVHPTEGHDIPGVRSIRQLQQTKLFRREQYNAMVEVHDRNAFELTLRLNREESIIAGPSSGMALYGALQHVEDKPGNIVVVIFPDNIFKYASSVQRHFPEMFKGQKKSAGAQSQRDQLMEAMIENERHSPADTVEIDEVHALMETDRPVLIDVRNPDIHAKQHLPGILNIPTAEMSQPGAPLPADKDAPIVTVCNVGNASLSGMLMLKSLGYRNVRSMNGGTRGWADKGYPTESGTDSDEEAK